MARSEAHGRDGQVGPEPEGGAARRAPPGAAGGFLPPERDTIAAVATAAGAGGIGIVRVSGPAARDIAAAMLACVPEPRRAFYGGFLDAEQVALDRGIALFFPGPHSYTGEDCLEFQGHGGQAVLELVLSRVLSLGARRARPGEFSERAFLNGRLDLAQAEAVADLIHAGSAAAARAAARSLEGAFSRKVAAQVARLVALRVQVEAALDFSDEGLVTLPEKSLRADIETLVADIETLTREAHAGTMLRDGLRVAIVGPPNAGKSSLLNALSGEDAAIVSPHPGTTRDLVRRTISVEGIPVHLTDTAGLRESADEVESEGVRRAEREIGSADHVLLVVDDTALDSQETAIVSAYIQNPAAGQALTVLRNKIDRSGRAPGAISRAISTTEIAISVKTGRGIDTLRSRLIEAAGVVPPGASTFSARPRHLEAMVAAQEALGHALEQLHESTLDVAAEELRLAGDALGTITGACTPDDLLGKIFSEFCVGK